MEYDSYLCACTLLSSCPTKMRQCFHSSSLLRVYDVAVRLSLQVLDCTRPCVVVIRKTFQFSGLYLSKRVIRSNFFRSQRSTLSSHSNEAYAVHHHEKTIPTRFSVVVHLPLSTDLINMRAYACLLNPNLCYVRPWSIISSNDIDTSILKRSERDCIYLSGIRIV